MKKNYLQVFSLVFIGFLSQASLAQTSETIVLKPGEDLFEKYPGEVYAYPEFKFGKVYYTNGDSAGGKMNYNNLLATIEFVDNKHDTLVFSPESDIKYIIIGEDLFYYNKPEYLIQIAGSATCKLAVKKRLKLGDVKKIGAYGIANSTSTIDSYDELRADQTHKLIHNEELVLVKENFFYLGNEKNVFLPASKKNILKLFPSKKKDIEAYLAVHTIDFKNEADLLLLLDDVVQGRK
jgi:hypothetical protein